ncbi:MAG TPA: hypothetical protein VNU96_18985 [Burkholderiales bacterium]|jgi:hypothetical protein|nr:hypothetical protein [Burkholderiales bacterium]
MRYTKLAAVPAAILVLGIMSVTACSPRPHQPEVVPSAAATPGPALETFYVPAQHVNKGQVEEPIVDFY